MNNIKRGTKTWGFLFVWFGFLAAFLDGGQFELYYGQRKDKMRLRYDYTINYDMIRSDII